MDSGLPVRAVREQLQRALRKIQRECSEPAYVDASLDDTGTWHTAWYDGHASGQTANSRHDQRTGEEEENYEYCHARKHPKVQLPRAE